MTMTPTNASMSSVPADPMGWVMMNGNPSKRQIRGRPYVERLDTWKVEGSRAASSGEGRSAAPTRAGSRSAITGLPGFSTSSTCFERLGASSTESSR